MKRHAAGAGSRGRLLSAARKAQGFAYAPYTHYRVGAAVLGASGKIYGGCNVESPTIIAHVCAERAAIFHALSHGEREIIAVCTVSRASEPCGSCRQLIKEFGKGDVTIYSLHSDPETGKEKLVETTISKLLPRAHTVELLEREHADER